MTESESPQVRGGAEPTPQPPCVYTAAETIAILGSLLFAPAAGTFRDMIGLAIVCGIFAGFAARRFLSARDAWVFWRLRRGTLPGLRGLFFTDARRSVAWALGAVVLIFLVVHLG
jgi:hypothetical protein